MKILLLLSALLLFSCGNNPVDSTYKNNDEYAIYKLILETSYAGHGRFILLNDSTAGEQIYVPGILEEIEGLSGETVTDYIIKNEKSIKLQKIKGIDSLFFRSEFMRSNERTVTIWFSRVGFNSFRNQALVSIGAVYGPLAGNGFYIFLVKEKYKWIIKESLATWIS